LSPYRFDQGFTAQGNWLILVGAHQFPRRHSRWWN
jgi:hypothetical protein